MKDEPQADNYELFAKYAGDSLDTWKKIMGRQVTHTTFGRGTIVKVGPGKHSDIMYIWIRFDEDRTRRQFLRSLLGNQKFFSNLTLPDNLDGIESVREQLRQQRRAEERQRKLAEQAARRLEEKRRQEKLQREKEAADTRHFAILRKKYLVTKWDDSSPSCPLYKTLLHLEEKETLNDADVDWLKRKRLPQLLAFFYEQEHNKCGKKWSWSVVRACGCWRDAGHPENALALTKGVGVPDDGTPIHADLLAALLTTRGGAFRDLRDFTNAEHCAFRALELSPKKHYAHNLLGAVYYQTGRAEKGYEYFQKAIELGAPPEKQDGIMDNALRDSEEAERKHVAEYLLWKDSERYSWAQHYLK